MDSPFKGGLRGASPVHFTVQNSRFKKDSKYLIFLSNKFNPDMSDIFSQFYNKNPIFIINVREAHCLYHEMYRS